MTARFEFFAMIMLMLAVVCCPVRASDGCEDSARSSAPEPDRPAATEYTSFRQEKFTLYAWKGEDIAFLTRSDDLDPWVMDRLCRTFDQVYDYYAHAAGCHPRPLPHTSHHGRSTISEIGNTCGAGCGYLGAKGIELMPGAFRSLYEGVRDRDEYDQTLFYEFGRNFWFYANKIGYKPHSARIDTVETGYAVFMRFMAAEVTGVAGGPFAGRSWAEFRQEVGRMVDYYMADENLDWDNTLKIGRAPANPMKLGAADLFAGFLLKLYEKHGGLDYVSRLWHEVGRRPKADDIQDAVDNLIVSASIAAGENLSEQFSEWRWPVSDAARTEIDRLLDIQSPDSRDVGGSRIWTERSRIDENRYGQNRKTELSEIGGSDQCGNRD